MRLYSAVQLSVKFDPLRWNKEQSVVAQCRRVTSLEETRIAPRE